MVSVSRCTALLRAMMLAWALCRGSACCVNAASDEEQRLPPAAAHEIDFKRDIEPLFAEHCRACHGADKQKSDYRLDSREAAIKGGESGEAAIIPGASAKSPLVWFVAGLDADLLMPPKKSDNAPLSAEQIGVLRAWIDQGAKWPANLSAKAPDPRDWWSLKPIVRPAVPHVTGETDGNPIDAFILAKLHENGLAPSPPADARTLIRRLYFDLTGLPPSPEEVDAFVGGSHGTYQQLVDRLLASPRYGERWARHWLDVVHFGETHGYDKDQPRPNAWPYRDYVIRALNEDKPYARFVQEQIAGDVLFPGTADGMEALGFLSAGPWDLIGHAEVPETKIDGKIARHLDRDDMVSNTLSTFSSLTVHCAQCHNHKFDPIPQADYYSLQAVFAAVDRTDKAFDLDPHVAAERSKLTEQQRQLKARETELRTRAAKSGGRIVELLDRLIREGRQGSELPERAEFGWHSAIEKTPDAVKHVQVDLGASHAIESIVLAGCHDTFNQIGAGFGFPVRFKVELSNDETFQRDVFIADDQTGDDFPNPGVNPRRVPTAGRAARYIRVTATKLAPRKDDFIFALAELQALDKSGRNVALGAGVSSLDSIEAAPRWSRLNLTDGYYYGSIAKKLPEQIAALEKWREEALARTAGDKSRDEASEVSRELAAVEAALRKLPPPRVAFVAAIHHGSGNFLGTGATGGKPRPISLLARGDVTKPGVPVAPGALSALSTLPATFEIAPDAPEGDRRAALAKWLTDPRNPLTWRSIVNRVWQYHFGRGLVDSPNDFGRMGQLPSHPELLDWLAAQFRDRGGSLKELHRLIVTSRTYRQSSAIANPPAVDLDSENRLLWRQNRRKLEAEAIRDSMLAVAGELDLTMGGPSFQDFVIEKPEHSPHYRYDLADPNNPKLHRRSIYRFLVRSQQQPFMAALDCADPSMLVEKRNQTITPLQALAQLNNELALSMAKHFAQRLQSTGMAPGAQVTEGFRLTLGRLPTDGEREALVRHAAEHGLANTCRAMFNLNEFTFID